MDFNDSTEEAAFRAEARAWLEKTLGPPASRAPIKNEAEMLKVSKADQAKKAEAGYVGLTWRKDVGGRELPPIFQVIFSQEEQKFLAPVSPFGIGLGMCIPTVIAFHSADKIARYVPPALRGEEIWCQLFSEPSAGSDVAGLKTKAVKDGDDWIVNGQKVWTSGAHYCDYGILLVRTNPEKEKHKGLTMFVVNMKAPGVEVRPIHQMSGGSNFNEVYFTDVRISDKERLGEVGNGWNVALVTLMNERLAVGGSAGPEYGEILELARNTPSPSGKGSLLQDQAFREKLAGWYVSAEGYTLGKYRTMTALSKGQTPGPENSIGKLLNANRMQDLSNAALEAEDHFGIISDPEIAAIKGAFHNAYMWAPGLRIAGGTDEILRNIIAERVLGLPADMRADRGMPFNKIPAPKAG